MEALPKGLEEWGLVGAIVVACFMLLRQLILWMQKRIDAKDELLAQQYDKALEYYPKAIAASPTDAALHNNLGDVYARMGKLTEAQQEFQKAADLNPGGAAQYYFNLGAIMYNIGKMDEAAAAFKKVTERDPTRADAYYLEGLSLMGKASMTPDGKVTAPPGTVEALESYLRLQPNGKNVAEAQGMLQTIQGKIDTQYKAAPKKKKN
jgi:tetratricopeptide (TPR) repeat protein